MRSLNDLLLARCVDLVVSVEWMQKPNICMERFLPSLNRYTDLLKKNVKVEK